MVKLNCAIVGVAGSSFPVNINENELVGDLKDAIKDKNSATITCDARELQLFLTKKTDGTWLTENDVKKGINDTSGLALLEFANVPLNLDGLSEEEVRIRLTKDDYKAGKGPVHVLVVVPKPKRPAEDEGAGDVLKRSKTEEVEGIKKSRVLDDFKILSVSTHEFQLDSLFMTQQSNSPIVRTPDLHEFWKGFGEFPPYYFVRMEECVFWKVIKPLLFGENRVVIIGSPGVGKSCFLMLIAFYLACIKKKKVLVLRRLKEKNAQNALVFLDGVGSYARLKNLSSHELHTIRQQVDTAIRQKDGDAIVLVDGFRQDDLHLSSWIEPFHCLATSCQFDAKHDDRAEIVVLPAWSETNLLQYAKSTNWVIDTGLRKIKNLIDTTWRKLVNEQYFYSGGSLREFCKEREVLKLRVAKDCRYVNNAQAFDFVYNYGGGQSKDQVDRLRRHYISDCTEEKHYYDSTYWKLYVDSGYVLSELGRIIDVDKQLEIYKYAKAVGAGFHGVAYEQLLHTAVRGAIANGTPIVLELKEGSKYEKIEIQVSNVICMGDNEALCYPCLSQLGHDTYWYPNYPFFPFIDAVTSCYAFPKGGNPKKIVAYIQVTIRSEKKFKDDRLRKLNEQMDQNELLKDMERVFVVVGPDSGVCERFTLRDAPDPETFLTMVSCFNPEQLESKAS